MNLGPSDRKRGRIIHEREVEDSMTNALAGQMIQQAGQQLEIIGRTITHVRGDILTLNDGTKMRFWVIESQSSFTEAALAENERQAAEQAAIPDPIAEHGKELMRGADDLIDE